MTTIVIAFDAVHHGKQASAVRCGQGGIDCCSTPPEFTVLGEKHTVSACATHLAGAVRQANQMEPVPA